MRVLEVEGETVDQALFKGLEEMQLTVDEVEMEVIDYGKKGFMGIGSKPAKIKLTEREEAVVPEFVLNKEKSARRPARDRGDRKSRSKREERTEYKKEITGEYFSEGCEFVENEVTEFLKGLMEHIGITGTVKAANTDNGLLVNLEGDDMGLLIGRRGETLDAVQYLASLVYNKDKEDYHRVTVDTENYRKKRENTLVRLAKKKAAQAVRTGRRVVLEPMTPFERRIIHFALQNDEAVVTYSEGEEPNRHIVIDIKK